MSLKRIISVLDRYINKEAIKDLDNIKKNLDVKKLLSSRQLKEKVREIIKKEDLIIQPRLNSISVCKNNPGRNPPGAWVVLQLCLILLVGKSHE